ncbi:MAG: NADH:ubiquinone oxidoreductase subunit RnfE [Oscillospiraceae bacterium]|nr:NADH:ubiquinone oxidoreductase subunit RnfE [Oscillospiraceae bacterium]
MKTISDKPKIKARPSDGFVRQNIVLMSGLLTGPVIAGAKDFESAAAISIVFVIITFFSVAFCRLVPRKLVYTLRIILYAIVASALYIPAVLACEYLMGEEAVLRAGIYLPVLVVNHVILSKTETRFFQLSYGQMLIDTAGYIGGFVCACFATGIIRDLLVNARIGMIEIETGFDVPALETTFGGFIVVGVLAGLCRALYNRSQNQRNQNRLNQKKEQE